MSFYNSREKYPSFEIRLPSKRLLSPAVSQSLNLTERRKKVLENQKPLLIFVLKVWQNFFSDLKFRKIGLKTRKIS